MTLREQLAEENPDLLLLDEEKFDEAIIGIVFGNNGPIATYDCNKIIDILNQDMSYEEAAEYYSFNIEGADVGEQTPIYVTMLKDIL